MSVIPTTGLISGINTAQIIDGLMAIEARGKTALQQRIASLTSQRTAMLDINARLLNLKNASKSFRLDKIFQSALATSSDEEILTATAGTTAQPGTYQFIVKQLVTKSQQLSKGFADKDVTPLGLEELTFEFGQGMLSRDRELESLNGGAGVDRGRIKITDRAGVVTTVDLTDVTSLNEVMERINSATANVVTATVDGDHLVLTDSSGGLGSLTVANGTGDTTATDLGIAGTIAGTTLTGTTINTISGTTALSSLNDGTGVLVRNGVTDFTVTARDGTAIAVKLGRIDAPITGATLLTDLNNGSGVTIGDDENKDIKFIARDGTEHEVSLNGITTVGGLISRVSTATGGKIAITVHADGERLTVTDTTGGAGTLKVLGAGDNGTDTAEELGILNVAGVAAATFNGSPIPNTISDPPATTIANVIARINEATGNAGKVVASIAADGVSLLLTDTTGGGGNLIVRGSTTNPHAAAQLGIETDVAGIAAATIDGSRLIAGLGTVLTKNLNGGDGLGTATTITLTDRSGATFTLNNLNTYDSLDDIIDAINDAAVAGGVDVAVGFNSTGSGLQVTDSSGSTVGNLIISGDAATALGIAGNVAADTVRGTNVQHKYVSEGSLLKNLNYGRGVGTGRFKISDALGGSATVDIGSDSKTLFDVIDEINSRGLAINARVNDQGDGIIIESDLDVGEVAVSKLKITSTSGTVAKDLGIIGEAETVVDGFIDGSYEKTVDLEVTDNLAKVVTKINAAGIAVNASIISSGGGATPFRINFTSAISGKGGEMLIDTGATELGITSLTRGEDAKVFFGGSTPEDGFLITSSTNTISSAIEGVTVNLKEASDDPVTLTVERDTAKIVDKVKSMVTTFNDVIGRIDQYDFFDVDAEKKGILLGNPTTSRLREQLFRTVNGKAQGVTTQYHYLRQVGVTIGAKGQLSFDEDKFRAAYESDPEAVKNLFAAFESSPATTEEIAPGVTITQNDPTVTTRGFGDIFDDLMDKLTNSSDGVVTRANEGFQDQIDLNNKRIEEFDIRLQAKRERLEAQYTAMEVALAKIQGQSGSLQQLANSVNLARSFGNN